MAIREDLAYDIAVRALDEQRLALDSLRTRAGLVLAMGAIINVELGRLALTDGPISQPAFAAGGTVAALAALYLLGRLCLAQRISIYPPPSAVADCVGPFGLPDQELKALLIRAMEVLRHRNEAELQDLAQLLPTSLTLLLLSGLSWAVAIVTRG